MNAVPRPASGRGGLGQQAYDRLLEEIQGGQLRPSHRVVEEEIAARLGISRTPVREALQRLQNEGLVVQAPKGLAITTLDHSMVVELYAVREVLEGSAAALAAQHAAEPEVAILQHLCEREGGLLGDPDEGARHNRRFHQTLVKAAHNRYLLRTLSALSTALALLGNYTRHIEGRAEQAAREHVGIVTAIAARDPALAEATARAHVRAAQRARLTDLSIID